MIVDNVIIFKYDDDTSNLKLTRCHAEHIEELCQNVVREVFIQQNLNSTEIDIYRIVGSAKNVRCTDDALVCDMHLYDTPNGAIFKTHILNHGTSSIDLSIALICNKDANGVKCDGHLNVIGLSITDKATK